MDSRDANGERWRRASIATEFVNKLQQKPSSINSRNFLAPPFTHSEGYSRRYSYSGSGSLRNPCSPSSSSHSRYTFLQSSNMSPALLFHQPRRSNVFRIKLITLGEQCSGKSSVLKTFCENDVINANNSNADIMMMESNGNSSSNTSWKRNSISGSNSSSSGSSQGTNRNRIGSRSGSRIGNNGSGNGNMSKYLDTIGVDYGVKDILIPKSDQFIRMNMFDLAGAREYYEVRREFYGDASGLILCYDPTRRETFEKLDQWMNEYRNNAHGQNMCISDNGESRNWSEREGNAPIVLCATKVRNKSETLLI